MDCFIGQNKGGHLTDVDMKSLSPQNNAHFSLFLREPTVVELWEAGFYGTLIVNVVNFVGF